MTRIATALLIALGATTAGGQSARDTTFPVPAGARVSIVNSSGDIEVRAISGRQARALANGEGDGIEIRRSGDEIRLRPRYDEDADLVIHLPRDVSIEIRGSEGDILVIGFERTVVVETLEGSIEIAGASSVVARSVDGDVRVRDVRGPVVVETGDGHTHIVDADGPIVVDGIDGDITVEGGDSRDLVLSTVRGDLWYDGPVHDGGEYALATHDGDVTLAIDQDAGAHLEVLTYAGALFPSFPIQLRGAIGSVAEFTLGSGSARVRLESFDGDIYLIRPGERSPRN